MPASTAEMTTMYQGVEKDSAAFRLMQQMGWEEGSGLGKDKQGMKQHIRLRQKQDNMGLGLDNKTKAQALWKVNTMEYDNVLKKLKVVVGKAVEKDEENEEAEVSNVVVEAKQSTREELRVIKSARPHGRYKKREIGKLVGSYSATDLAAILGGVQGQDGSDTGTQVYQSNKFTSVSSTKVDLRDQRSKDGSLDNVQEEVEEEVGPPAAKKVCREQTEEVFEDLPADWWGNRYGFVRAGKLGASSGTLKTERTAFHEKDQEELALLAAKKATKGKQGLGAAERIKVGKGAGWKGQRKALAAESDEEDNDGGEDHKESTVSSTCKTNSEVESKPQSNDIVMTENSKNDVCDGGKLKLSSWKKVCKQLLREAPLQTLSLKRLEKRFVSTMLSTCGAEVRLDREKLQKSSKFVVEGKRVTLSSA